MIISRILKYLEEKEITKYRFCKNIGVSNGFLAIDRAIGTDKCELIFEHFPDLNPTWLLIGKGEMILKNELISDNEIIESKKTILDIENERIIKEIRKLNKEDQERILITIDALIKDAKIRNLTI